MFTRPALPPLALALAAGFALSSTAAFAGPRVGEVIGSPSTTTSTVQARVVSSTPVVAQMAVPTQVCRDEWQQAPARASGAGALMGAIAGGAAGNAVGKGAGRALATGIGIIAGAAVGNNIESNGRPGTATPVRRCDQQAGYENRVVAYNVVYEFAGQRYSTQMGQEPGNTIPLQVTLTPMVPGPVTMTGHVSSAAPGYWDGQPEGVYEDDGRWDRHWEPRRPGRWD